MALQTEVWVRDIQEQLFASNEFLNFAVNHSEFVNNKVVHVPIAGSAPNVEIDRSSLPAAISQRTDTELTYTLQEFTTDPMLITDLEDIQVSYNKRQSVLGHHVSAMADLIAQSTLVDWAAPTANVIPTSGADDSIKPVGATGTRKAVTLADIRSAAGLMDKQNVPKNDRYLMMDSDMYYQLLADNAVLSSETMGSANLPAGVVRQLFGFNILTRSSTPIYDVANAVKAVGAAGAVTDNLSCIAWQSGFVAKAMGSTKVYADEDKPEYYGSVFSAMQLHKGTKLRSTGVGCVAIVQVA